MKPHVLQSMLWTVAATLLFYWFIVMASNYHPPQHPIVIVHGKVCPAPLGGGYYGGK